MIRKIGQPSPFCNVALNPVAMESFMVCLKMFIEDLDSLKCKEVEVIFKYYGIGFTPEHRVGMRLPTLLNLLRDKENDMPKNKPQQYIKGKNKKGIKAKVKGKARK